MQQARVTLSPDGRLKVGDSIVEIDCRPVYQMSILRARAYITDLALFSTKPVTLTILRSIETFSDENNIDQKSIFSALQAANT
ncbi:unnamed protein product [Caenorhabditis angaria]|uniref:PDZ domain-containing protein n=1 Tax=Caenorhabditis angaria TaxID=860376 RepID=A0A9P1INT7_9PELO|nr:unnamed protein product [Caenorhabditis angaria]